MLGFEPLIDKYGESLANYKPTGTSGSMKALGRQHETWLISLRTEGVACSCPLEISLLIL